MTETAGAAHSAPATPQIRTPAHYLWWLVASQPRRALLGALFGSLWMVGLVAPPYFISRAIDDGMGPGRYHALLGWTTVLLGVGAANAFIGMLRHRTMTKLRMDASFRTIRTIVAHATKLGAALPRRVTSGEVVTIGISDVWIIANALTVTGPGVGGAVAYAVVAVLLLAISPLLAIVVLAGVPVLAVLVGPLLGRLQKTGGVYREQQGVLAERIVDIIGGLRVLNGLGGKDLYAARYRHGSHNLRAEGYRVGAVSAWVQALGVGLPALFLAIVTALAARLAEHGTITVGQLVAVYGYVAVLVVPVAFFIEGAFEVSHGLVSAGRVTRFLKMRPSDVGGSADAPKDPAVLRDPTSGVEVLPGHLVALATGRTAEAVAIVDRLGRFAPSDVTWGGVRLDTIDLGQTRRRILVADNEADLFAGTLRDVVAGAIVEPDAAVIDAAVAAALARDIVQGLPDGLDSAVGARGRTLSGGQRQRIRLARALAADPEVLIAIEPTSAVDAHTEAAIASRLRIARAGRTTVVTTTSPLLLDSADIVFFLVDGVVARSGTHRILLADEPRYRALVSRDTSEALR